MQQKAQQKLVQLNLAYEEALKAVQGRPAAMKDIPAPVRKRAPGLRAAPACPHGV